jgi:hypothetical protein
VHTDVGVGVHVTDGVGEDVEGMVSVFVSDGVEDKVVVTVGENVHE